MSMSTDRLPRRWRIRAAALPAIAMAGLLSLIPGASASAQVGLGRDTAGRIDSLAVTPVESPTSVQSAADRAGVGPALVRVEDLLADRLGTAIAETRKFTLVTRSRLDAVLAEQAFAASGFVDARDPAAAQAMKVAGVRWLAVPRVVDFEDAVRSRRFPGIDREVVRRTIRVAISVDILDSTTGVVGETATVTVEATDTADEDTQALPEGSPPNAAMLDTLATEAAQKVACRLLDVAYPATVLAANGSVVTINRGDGGCLEAGAIWVATRRGEALVDPDTGEVLGFDEADTGAIEITRIESRLARARVLAGEVSPGDVLRPMPAGAGLESLAFDGAAVGRGEVLRPGGGGAGAAARPEAAGAGGGSAADAETLAALGVVAVVATGSDVRPEVLRSIETEVAGATAAQGLRVVVPSNVVARRDASKADADDASLLRLAEAVGARWLLVVSVGSDDGGTSSASVNGQVFQTTSRSIRGSWRLVAGTDAASVAGRVFEGTASRMAASGGGAVAVDTTRPLDREAASDAAASIAAGLAGTARLLADAAAASATGGFIRIEASLDGLVVPEIVETPDGGWRVEATSLPVMVGGVEVALDGFVIGSTPCTIETTAGPHRMRLTRQGVETWDRAVRVLGRDRDQPQLISVGLRPTAEARSRYLENAAVVRGLEAGAALTDAQVDAIRGFATFLEQSGYRIDVRKSEDVRIDSDQVPQTMQWNSFWSRW